MKFKKKKHLLKEEIYWHVLFKTKTTIMKPDSKKMAWINFDVWHILYVKLKSDDVKKKKHQNEDWRFIKKRCMNKFWVSRFIKRRNIQSPPR